VQEFLLLFPVASNILNTILDGIANEIFWCFLDRLGDVIARNVP
jgi:hypothetical protein